MKHAVPGARCFIRHRLVWVDSAVAALGAIAADVRRRSRARVVAITGSTGKTSTKDILAALLGARMRTVASTANYNNEIGVPLTLCRIERGTEAVVCELGMRGAGPDRLPDRHRRARRRA